MQDENPDVIQGRFWITLNSRIGCMGSDKGIKAPWIATCDSEISKIEESAKIKRSILAGKMKHTKLSKKRKAIRLVDLNSRKFHRRLMGEVYKSPATWIHKKAIQITASQLKQSSS